MAIDIGSALLIVWIVLLATFMAVFLRAPSRDSIADLDSRDPMDDRAAWRDARAERQRPPTRSPATATKPPAAPRVKPGKSIFIATGKPAQST